MPGASPHSIEFFSAPEIEQLLSFDSAIGALEHALRAGLDPEHDGPRLFADAPNGEFLIMPAQSAQFTGIKTLTVAPRNPARGLEKIQGFYLLFDSDTLTPIAVLEGSRLTAIRTPAVTLTAIRHLARLAPRSAQFGTAPRILVFGAGTQALGHIRAALVDFPAATFEIVGRRPERIDALIATLSADPATATVPVAPARDTEKSIAQADIIILATTSTTPVLDGSLVSENTIVAAVGTHGLEAREVDDVLVARCDLAVEGRASARNENGNLITAYDAETWSTRPPANLQDLVLDNFTRTPGRPALYTGVGMSWEDLVCASAVYEARAATR